MAFVTKILLNKKDDEKDPKTFTLRTDGASKGTPNAQTNTPEKAQTPRSPVTTPTTPPVFQEVPPWIQAEADALFGNKKGLAKLVAECRVFVAEEEKKPEVSKNEETFEKKSLSSQENKAQPSRPPATTPTMYPSLRVLLAEFKVSIDAFWEAKKLIARVDPKTRAEFEARFEAETEVEFEVYLLLGLLTRADLANTEKKTEIDKWQAAVLDDHLAARALWLNKKLDPEISKNKKTSENKAQLALPPVAKPTMHPALQALLPVFRAEVADLFSDKKRLAKLVAECRVFAPKEEKKPEVSKKDETSEKNKTIETESSPTEEKKK